MARAHGIDISKWQVSFDATVKPDDIHFVIMRAGIGIMPDPIFNQLYDSIQPVPIRGAYHYFGSDWGWKDQADHFLSLVQGRNFHFFALDVETVGNQRSAGYANGASRWLEYVAEKTGKKVLLYTNPIVYKTWLQPYGNWMAKWPLWIAQYWFEPDRNKNPRLPDGAKTWKFWQYSADGNFKGKEYGAKSKHLDLDVFNGTRAELRAWLGLEAEEPPPVTVEGGVDELPEGLDLDVLARKLALMVAPIVAAQLKQSGGGISFGPPGQPVEPPGIEVIKGLDPSYQELLLANGIANVNELAYLGETELAEVLEIPETRAIEFLEQARRLAGPPE